MNNFARDIDNLYIYLFYLYLSDWKIDIKAKKRENGPFFSDLYKLK